MFDTITTIYESVIESYESLKESWINSLSAVIKLKNEIKLLNNKNKFLETTIENLKEQLKDTDNKVNNLIIERDDNFNKYFKYEIEVKKLKKELQQLKGTHLKLSINNIT